MTRKLECFFPRTAPSAGRGPNGSTRSGRDADSDDNGAEVTDPPPDEDGGKFRRNICGTAVCPRDDRRGGDQVEFVTVRVSAINELPKLLDYCGQS